MRVRPAMMYTGGRDEDAKMFDVSHQIKNNNNWIIN